MGSEEWKNRHLMDGRDQCSPTEETMNRLPGIDTVEDQNLILGPLWQLAPIFFLIMFPHRCLRVHLGAGDVKTVLLARLGS